MNEDHSLAYSQLLIAIEQGNERAFVMLYDMFSKDLSHYILSKVSDADLAQDILHDLFLSVWKNKDRLAEIKSLPAYLYSSCRYLIMANYRKKILKEVPAYNLDQLDVLDESVPLEDRLHYRYIIDLVEEEIERLPEKCQAVFKLSRYEYLSNKEIAERMNIAESTVEKHINKAISRLKVLTKNYTILF
ncbi:sigma-70 family RNA polymerase sigma factor [Sphingobacterium sp. WM]|uniref:RNA polymerase sigma factor n=1 Tax=Sphingobacterium sp. WM TaxID=3031802 RepID=UPI00240E3AAA|nr:sigma-70 family RNA polymerase sigma factor [Sphingobacterium sp. WM]WFB62402.1 sigma-70 family RNA polymerase sigma factor [Sphingobacterium sp. WM]